MKFKIFLIIICTGIVLPSTAWNWGWPWNWLSSLPPVKREQVNSELRPQVSFNPKKINEKGEYQPYYGYTIIAKIDPASTEVAKNIEEIIRQSSSLNKSYSALPADTYHMSIYTIYSCGNKLIPPVQRWIEATGQTISNRKWLPHEVLTDQNNKAICILERYLNEPLKIKYARLKIFATILGLTLELEEESLQRIRSARTELAKLYEHPNVSMEPLNKRLHITLAYAYGKQKTVDTDERNRLNELAQSFNGTKLSLPYVYLYDSMKKYYPFQKNIDCRSCAWRD